jgi:glutamyl-tRNA synthetase
MSAASVRVRSADRRHRHGRNKPEWTEGIISALAATNIRGEVPAFEGPYFQSRNADRHREVAQQLFAAGQAY